jgi:hypothetical protein
MVAASRAQEQTAGSAAAGESQMTLRKSVQSREYQGKAIAGEERSVGRGDSLWRILIQEKGLPEKRFQSYLVVIRGLNPQVKDLNVLRIGDTIFIPLRPDEAVGLRSAKTSDIAGPPTPGPTGATTSYRVKAGDYLYQILRDQLGVRDEQQALRYFALTKDLNPQRKDWDLLREGETIRLPALGPAQDLAEAKVEAAAGQKPAEDMKPGLAPPPIDPSTPPPAMAGSRSPATAPEDRGVVPSERSESKGEASDAPGLPGELPSDYARRVPGAAGVALFASVVESLGAQLQRTGEEVVAVKGGAVRFDKSSYPVVYNPKIKQKVVLDPAGNIPASLRRELGNPDVGTPVVSLNPKTSLQDAVSQLLAGLGYQTLPTDRPVVIQEAGVAYEAKGTWMALAPEESNKPQEIFVINLTDRPGGIPDYLLAQMESKGLHMRDVVVSSSQSSQPAAAANDPKGLVKRTKVWPREKREIVDSLLFIYGLPFGVAEMVSIKLRDGLTVETRADRVFEAGGKKVALFFQRAAPELKKALEEKGDLKILELEIASMSSREIIARLLSELGEQANYREHRFPAASGVAPDRLVVSAWGFHLPKRSLFVTDRDIPQSLHRFFFDKGLEIVYFQ